MFGVVTDTAKSCVLPDVAPCRLLSEGIVSVGTPEERPLRLRCARVMLTGWAVRAAWAAAAGGPAGCAAVELVRLEAGGSRRPDNCRCCCALSDARSVVGPGSDRLAGISCGGHSGARSRCVSMSALTSLMPYCVWATGGHECTQYALCKKL